TPRLVSLGVAFANATRGARDPCSSSGRTFQRGWTATCMADTVLHKLQLQPDNPEAFPDVMFGVQG
ncbi:unnamed protein product, partial [Effrenium voratum]